MHLLQHESFESQLQKWARQGAGTDMFGVHFCHRGLELQVGLFHLSLPLLLQLQQRCKRDVVIHLDTRIEQMHDEENLGTWNRRFVCDSQK